MSKQDIRNIKEHVQERLIRRHSNDSTSVALLVAELQAEEYDPVLIYKHQGNQANSYPEFSTDTFVLAIQTKFQRDVYCRFASSILCIDSTHGTNAYGFKLITCIVVDNFGNGNENN